MEYSAKDLYFLKHKEQDGEKFGEIIKNRFFN